MCNQCKIFTEKGLYYCPESYDPFIYCPFCGEKLQHSVKEDKAPEVYETLFDYLRSMDAATSAKLEINLYNVARGSLEELKIDYLDYLRQHNAVL